MRRFPAAILLAVVVAASSGQWAAISTASNGAGGWSDDVRVSGRLDRYSDLEVSTAVDKHGRTYVAWVSGHTVHLAHRRPGDGWGGWHIIDHRLPMPPQGARIEIASNGDMALAWAEGRHVTVMRKRVGHAWSDPVNVARLPRRQELFSWPLLAIGPDGTVLVAFWRGHVGRCPGIGTDCTLRHATAVAVVRPDGGHWRHPHRLAGPFEEVWGYRNSSLLPGTHFLPTPVGAVYGRGTVSVGWVRPPKRHETYWHFGPGLVETKEVGASWFHQRRLTPRHGIVDRLELASDGIGALRAAWAWEGQHAQRVVSCRRKADASWSCQRLAVKAALGGLGMSRAGVATALISGRGAAGTFLVSTTPQGSWGSRHRIAPSGIRSAALRVADSGNAVAAWTQRDRTMAMTGHAPDCWSPPQLLGTRGVSVLAADIAENGGSAVAWYRAAGDRDHWVTIRANIRHD